MKKTFKSASILAVAALSATSMMAGIAGAAGKSPVDTQMANDLHLKANVDHQIITGGSSFDANLLTVAVQQFNSNNTKSTAPFAAYATSSSGTGRSSATGATSSTPTIGFSDFPLNQAGNSDTTSPDVVGNYVQVPAVLGGVGIIYNLGTSDATLTSLLAKYPLTLSGTILGKIFAADPGYTTWNNAAICALNPKLVETVTSGKKKTSVCALPDTTIKFVSRKAGSGTTYMFKDYLSKVDPADFPTSSNPNSAVFAGAAINTAGNSATIDGEVSATVGTIGYVEYGYGILDGNPMASIINASGVAVQPNAAGITAAATAGLAKIGTLAFDSLAHYSINNETGKTVYPISGFSYAIVKKNQTDSKDAIAIAKFLDFLVHAGGGSSAPTTFGQDFAVSQGYAPLPAAVQAQARTLIAQINVGGTSALSTTN